MLECQDTTDTGSSLKFVIYCVKFYAGMLHLWLYKGRMMINASGSQTICFDLLSIYQLHITELERFIYRDAFEDCAKAKIIQKLERVNEQSESAIATSYLR